MGREASDEIVRKLQPFTEEKIEPKWTLLDSFNLSDAECLRQVLARSETL